VWVANVGDEEFPKAHLRALTGGADKRGNTAGGDRWTTGAPSVSDIALVLEGDRGVQVVVVRQAQEYEFWILAKNAQDLGDPLGFLECVEAPMEIHYAFVIDRLKGVFDGKPDQFVAQRRKGVGLSDPDDDFEFQGVTHEQVFPRWPIHMLY
jgi:hypothetical protein